MRFFNLEPPDVQQLTLALLEADRLAQACCDGHLLSGTLQDLPILQQVIDQFPTHTLNPQQVQAIAAALGRVLLHQQEGGDWVIVQGAYQRGFAILRLGTLHWISPEGALRSHLHGQAKPNLQRLFASMMERLNPPALAA